MRVSRIIDKTKAEGPGIRFCIWVQGCGHHCRGCFAENLWNYEGGYEIKPEEIISQIKKVQNEIDGITFLGGEPFDKARDLADIAKFVKSIDKSVITFTGYVYEELCGSDNDNSSNSCNSCNSENDDWKKLLENTDLLIDGRFEESLLDYSRPLVGSSNQRFIFLTDKIKKEEIDNYKNRFEIRKDKAGTISFNGMGNIEKLKEYIKKLN